MAIQKVEICLEQKKNHLELKYYVTFVAKVGRIRHAFALQTSFLSEKHKTFAYRVGRRFSKKN